jgi:cytochrome P450
MKEALRSHAPVKQTLFRLPTKNIQIADVTVREGDYVIFAIDALNKDPSAFENPDTFDLTRFNSQKEKKLPKYQFMPFSIGRRMCLGKALGELMVKLTMSYFSRCYEVYRPQGVEYYEISTITNTVENPLVMLKRRKNN